jgi:hypothetical protein
MTTIDILAALMLVLVTALLLMLNACYQKSTTPEERIQNRKEFDFDPW